MSLLDVISGAGGAAVRVGLTPPASLFGSQDPNAPLLIAIAQEVGDELARRHDWQKLKVDYTVPTLAAEVQTALPTDYDHMATGTELWNRTIAWKYTGPIDDTEWGRIKAIPITGTGWWRLIGGGITITPAPTVGQTLAFTYVTKNWIKSNVGVPKPAFTADTDVPQLSERLLALGVIWAWKNNRGFDYAEFLASHERDVERECSRDRGMAPLIVGKSRPSSSNAVPYTWPGTIVP